MTTLAERVQKALAELAATRQAASRCEYAVERDNDAKALLEAAATRQAASRGEYAIKQLAAALALSVPEPVPAPAPAPAVPPVSIIVDGVAYDFTKAVRRLPFNATDRYELPLRDGLWFVLLDTPKLGHASYVVERRRPGVYGAALAPIGYRISVGDPRHGVSFTESIAEHGQWQRWRRQNREWPRNAVPDMRLMFNVAADDPAEWAAVVPEVTPLFAGGLTKAMGTTGLRPDIGPYSGWLARGLHTGDFGPALRQAEAAASIPWHVRDDAGAMVMLDGPENLSRQMETYYGTHSAPENTIRTAVGGWSMDTAHTPKVAWSAYVFMAANPDPYIVEEIQFEAAAIISQAAMDYTRTKSGLRIGHGQIRDYCWGMVSLVHALVATPESVPDWLLPRARFRALVEENIAFGTAAMALPGFPFVSVAASTWAPPSALAAGAIATQSSITDYVPVAMLHCYHLTSDTRFAVLGREHLDRRVAKRYRASPKYAALYAPVAIGAGTGWRFFGSWAEAYAAWGRTSDESTPWASFTRPTGTEAGADGKPLMPYTDETIVHAWLNARLYKAFGLSTPDIDWLADFLTAKRGNQPYTCHDQFAVA